MADASLGQPGRAATSRAWRGLHGASAVARTIGGRVWAGRRDRLTVIGGLYAALATMAVFVNQPGTWFGDNRFEQYVNPGRRLTRMFSIWDSTRGFGTFRTEWWPGATLPLAVLRLLGLSPAATLHVWHALLISVAGIGAVAFLRAFLPRLGVGHLSAGLLYMFGPYTVGFLLPSNLYLNYALAPWFWLIFYRGIHTARPWRSVAASALLVCAVGTTEVAGMVFTFAYFVPIALYAVLVDRTTSARAIWAWCWRLVALSSFVLAALVYVTVVGGEGYLQNLRETESPRIVNGNSSWAESWRGLGNWLIYHRDQTGFARPQTGVYLTSGLTTFASFAAPLLAVLGLGTSRRRVRVLAAMVMLMGLTVMVGLFPLDDPAPYGRIVDWLYDAVSPTSVLRNNYKAGHGAMWGVAVLAGLGLESVVSFLAGLRRRHPREGIMAAGVAGVVGVATIVALLQPFWRDNLYDADRGYDEVPGYVTDALAFVDEQPGDGRALFLPGAYRSDFRWGYVNDDVLDAFLTRPNLIEVPIHVSRDVPADILTAVDAALLDRHYREGVIGPLAERLGIAYIVVRNDFNWGTWEQPRPAEFSRLRRDPALELVATFGEVGENTYSPLDTSLEVDVERALPPIEVYRVRHPGGLVRVMAPAPDLLVSGDGEAWPNLAEDGLLDNAAGVRFTGGMSAAELVESFAGGASLLVTDTNRRQVELITVTGAESYTLGSDDELDRPPQLLWDQPGATSYAEYGDAERLVASSQVAFSGALQPWHRPAAAVDGDQATSWLVGALSDPRGQHFRIELGEPREITSVSISASRPAEPNGRALDVVTVRLADGSERTVALVDHEGTVDFGGQVSDVIDVELVATDGVGLGAVGLAEVEVAGLDLREWVAMPDDVVRRADGDAELSDALGDVATAYRFHRQTGDGLIDIERALRRRFVAVRDDTLGGQGAVRASPTIGEPTVARLMGTEILAEASTRFGDQVDFGGFRTVDGDPRSAWVLRAADGGAVDLRFAPTELRSVAITLTVGEGLAVPDEIELVAGESGVTVAVPENDCRSSQCLVTVTAELPGGTYDELVLTVPALPDDGVVRIGEVELNGEANERLDLDAAPEACVDDLLWVDGQSVGIALRGTLEDLIAGRSIPVELCRPLVLTSGAHRIEGGTDVLVDDLLIAPAGFGGRQVAPDAPGVELVAFGPTSFEATVDAPDGGTFVLTQSWHPGWHAELDTVDLGPAVEIDGFAGWRLPPGSSGSIHITHRWQRSYELAVLLTLLGVAVSLAILLRRPTNGRERGVGR